MGLLCPSAGAQAPHWGAAHRDPGAVFHSDTRALTIPDAHCLVTGGICKSRPISVRRWHFKKTTDGRVIHILYNKGESFLRRITKYVYMLRSVTFHSVFHSVAVKNKLVYDWFFYFPGTAQRDLWSPFSIDTKFAGKCKALCTHVTFFQAY